jgi:predicted metal-dependent hydrolase
MDEIPLEKIIRSRRRTIALEITSGATLVVRAPLRASSSDIGEIIRQKRSWILRKMDEVKRRPLSPGHEYAEGEMFLFLGRSYPLHIVENGSMTIERSDRLYVSSRLIPDIRNQLKHWYKEEARKEIQARCMWFSLKTGHVPATISITDARQR